jgi:phage terminase large subunit-like protein
VLDASAFATDPRIAAAVRGMTPAQGAQYVLQQVTGKQNEDRLSRYWPYRKQKKFHTAGAKYRERLLRAPNRVGKTLSAAMEVAMHATGLYAPWWAGWRSEKPTQGGVASETSLLTRDGAQRLLFGYPAHPLGHGTVPKRLIIGDPVRSHGAPDAFESVHVRHITGGESVIYLRSYDQGRERIQAMELDYFWADEEPDEDYYLEALTRTNIKRGPVFITFTPLKGMSTVVKRFMVDKVPGTIDIHMDLDDADHFTEEDRKVIEAQYPAHEREARAHGIPVFGGGRVFPVTEESIRVKAIEIPKHWPRICGLDFGWDHPTAAAWLAWDRDTDTVYVYDDYRVRETTPVVHAAALNARGKWIPVAWPHDGLQHDKGSGIQLAEQYRALGVNMEPEYAHFEETEQEGEGRVNLISVEAGIMEMLDRMQTGRFKVFEHLNNWWEEFRLYHRGKDGKLVKEGEDILSATRVACMSLRNAEVEPVKRERHRAPPSWRY